MTTHARTDAEALATFVRRLRPDWNHAGIVAAILGCHTAALSETAVALIRMAEDGTVQTPGLLNTPGKWWFKAGDQERPAGEAVRNRDNCLPHKADRATCPECERDRAKDAARPETIAAALAAARDAAANTRNRLGDQARRAATKGRSA